MRTIKALLCVAAVAAGVATSMAQSNVYSLNVVGYYNVTVGAGEQVMIANQLNTTNNTIGALLAPPMVHDGDALFKFSGANFSTSLYSDLDGQWDPSPNVTLNPGEAAFYKPVQATTLTFVGEVLQGQLVNTLPLGQKVMRSSMVPQQGLISANLGVTPDDGDFLYSYNVLQTPADHHYTTYAYSSLDGTWNPSEPNINVGQGFFYIKNAGANPANAQWVRNFTVQ